MPNWKKVITSGSSAALTSVTATAGFTAQMSPDTYDPASAFSIRTQNAAGVASAVDFDVVCHGVLP
jgi:hypothetical protein